MFIPDITNPFFATLAKGVEDYVNFRGFTLILCNYEHSGKTKKLYVDLLKQKYVDGIVFAAGELDPEDAMKIRKSEIPLVVLDRVPEMPIECEILVDNYNGAKQAMDHLLDIGCRKIAHIYGPQKISTARERLKAYEGVVQHFSWYTPSLLAPGNFTIEGGIEATKNLLEKHPDIDGIFAGNDMNAIGALKWLYQKGIKVPDDIAICGFDGINLTEVATPEITTVIQPTYEIGNLAAEHLIHYIEHAYFREKVIELDTKLVVRESTRKSGVKS